MMTLLTRFGLPEVSALYFENRVAWLWAEAEAMEKNGDQAPYTGLEQLMQMADEGEFGGGSSGGFRNTTTGPFLLRARSSTTKTATRSITWPTRSIPIPMRSPICWHA